MKINFVTLFGTLLIVATATFVRAEEIDCSLLDPRATISSETEAKVQASVSTLLKIARVGGSIEGKLKKEITNLQQGVPVSEQGQIALRTLYLFCGMVANAKDISTERKVDLYKVMMNQQNNAAPTKKLNMNKSSKSVEKTPKTDVLQTKQAQQPIPDSIVQNMNNSPGSIQIGKVEGPVVVNQSPSPRRIPARLREELISILSKNPMQAQVSSIMNNAEAFHFAQDWYDILKAAGWKMVDARVRLYEVGGGPPDEGVVFHLKGKPYNFEKECVETHKEDPDYAGHDKFECPVREDDPGYALHKSVELLNVHSIIHTSMDMPEGYVVIMVGPRPE